MTDNASNMLKAFSLPGFDIISAEEDHGDSDDSNDEAEEPMDTESTEYFYEQLGRSQHLPCFTHTLR